MGCSVMCDCGIFWSYSLTFWVYVVNPYPRYTFYRLMVIVTSVLNQVTAYFCLDLSSGKYVTIFSVPLTQVGQ